MRTSSWALLAALGASVALFACGGDETAAPGGAGGAGGAGGGATTTTTTTTTATTTATSTTATSVTATTSTGTTAQCTGLFPESDQCTTCLEEQCCAELAACDADPGCKPCLANDPACQETDALVELAGCLQAACDTPETCGDPEATNCNPVTGAPCDVAGGETCDAVNSGGYICFPPPNDAGLCEPCSNAQGPYCGAGLACLGGQCVRYCCDDGDCGSGKCDTSLSDPEGGQPVGYCLLDAGGGTGGGGTGGGGTGGGGTGGGGTGGGGTGGGGGAPDPQPACDAPATAPSNGSCYTVP